MRHLLPILAGLLIALLGSSACQQGSSGPERITLGALPSTSLPSRLTTWKFSPSSPENWLETTPGLWEGTPGEALVADWAHGDLELETEFKLTANAVAEVSLMGQYPIVLFAGKKPNPEEGFVPDPRYFRKPGIWQHLKVMFKGPRRTGDPEALTTPMLVNLYLNGALVAEDLALGTSPPELKAPLTVEVKQGKMLLRRSGYQLLDQTGDTLGLTNAAPLIPSTLQYRYYEGEGWAQLPPFEELTPVKSGRVRTFQSKEIALRPEEYGYVYESTLEATHPGRYTLGVRSDDGVRVWVNGEMIIENDGGHPAQTRTHTLDLFEGTHELKVEYYQGGGGATLSMFYEGRGLERRPLYSPSLDVVDEDDEGDADPVILTTDAYPYIQRAFIAYPSGQGVPFPMRRSHAVAVGEADGPHYSMDLSLGTLMSMWAGPFGTATEMWVGRGESQQFVPLGEPLDRSGRPDFAMLNSPKENWPDTLESYQEVLQFQGYELNEQGQPTFAYAVAGGGSLTDNLAPVDEKLRRTISFEGISQSLWHQIAQGEEIELESDNIYLVQGVGYRLVLEQAEGVDLFLRTTDQGQELLARSDGSKGRLDYVIEW